MYSVLYATAPAPNSRLTVVLEQLQREFDKRSQTICEIEHQLNEQVRELETCRQRVLQLYHGLIYMKQTYEAEIRTLQNEINQMSRAESHPMSRPNHFESSQSETSELPPNK